MAESNEFSIPDPILDEIRCSLCQLYLSCTPIQVLPNGKSICSTCSAATTDTACYRNLTIESMLRKIVFPCQYTEHGCKERLLFGHTKEHEAKCAYNVFICPILLEGTCSWQGTVLQIPNHFSTNHPELTKKSAEFKLELNQDKQEVFVVVSDASFIIKYVYSAETNKLQYDFRYTMDNVQETSCKIRVANDSNPDYSYTAKLGKCRPCNASFYNMQESKLLMLDKYLEILDNPTCVAITVDVSVTLAIPVVKPEKQIVRCIGGLQTVRCFNCRGSLLPPIFLGPSGVVCSSCHEQFGDSEPVEYSKLEQFASEADIYCCWEGCEFAGKRTDIRKHEQACEFRVFKCFKCVGKFTMIEAMAHITAHKYKYFFNTCIYNVLEKTNPEKKVFAVKNNEIVSIDHTALCVKEYYPTRWIYRHDFSLRATGGDSEIVLKVVFEHAHCAVKSEIFTVTTANSTLITVDNLPECFKCDGDLTVTLNI